MLRPVAYDSSQGHAGPEERLLYRAQLALLLKRSPQLAARLLDELDPIERRFIEDAQRAEAVLAQLMEQPNG